MLNSCSSQITSIQYLYDILIIIDNGYLCCGNEITQFKDVLTDEEHNQINVTIGKKIKNAIIKKYLCSIL